MVWLTDVERCAGRREADMKPHMLTFFCELEAEPLRELFATPGVEEDLVALDAGVSLGLLDLGPERAQVVQRLNRMGIPVTAWLLLPTDEGYWFHAGNVAQATARYEAFQAWTAEHHLTWEGVGLDIEPDIRELRRWMEGGWRQLGEILPRLVQGHRIRDARAGYARLMERIRADGYRVDAYQFPIIVDERESRSTLVQRLAGVLDLPADREVLMLYTSFLRPHGPSVLWSYGPGSQSLAVGVTGGGVELPGAFAARPLDWTEFSRDLRLAVRWTHDLHVFSLEGCVQQGFLNRLRTFDWDAPVTPPATAARHVDTVRRAARLLLRTSAWVLR
ncbi:hypothetical protein BHS09_15275 [Myxococcus xanthus]|uniref:Uncharacterized protein n=1 Tax=Myxococcus xanthus TaxID=34 RepID=A0AAE6KSI8_MYXXA|nr:hypothetical protein BHS09_15275 [Myxococcus xanthus]QDE75506.1 hypothetical protein BHS08_15290 [Myxococcus xanthus]QDF04629.1 hypothetical protein BHS04_15660 [Myxococcus xanthus]